MWNVCECVFGGVWSVCTVCVKVPMLSYLDCVSWIWRARGCVSLWNSRRRRSGDTSAAGSGERHTCDTHMTSPGRHRADKNKALIRYITLMTGQTHQESQPSDQQLTPQCVWRERQRDRQRATLKDRKQDRETDRLIKKLTKKKQMKAETGK